ncbi:MAG: lipopolysaccharide biosynthesis protein, partial [Candidatus Hodarchaeales archaeon]
MQLYKKIKENDFFDTLMHSKNYFFVNVATIGLSIITIPIFTRLYSQEDYGIISLYTAYLAIIVPIMTLNASSAVGRYYYEETEDFNEFLGTTIILVGSIFAISVMITVLFFDTISNIINLTDLLLGLMLVSAVFTIIGQIYFQVLIPQKRSKEVSIINVTSAYFTTGIAIILVISLEKNKYLGQIFASLLVRLVISVYFIYKLYQITKLTVSKKHLKYILAYSVPELPYILSSNIIAQFDRIMIGDYEDTSAVGIYSIGYNIASLLMMVIAAINTAIAPDFYKFYNQNQISRLDRLTKRVFSIIVIGATGLILFTDEIFRILVDKKFHDGKEVVSIVVFGLIFYAMFTIYVKYITYTKKTIYLAIIMLTSGISNVLLNVMFIPKYGYIAAAYTTAISYFILFFLSWTISKYHLKTKTTPISYIWKQTILFFLLILLYYIIIPQISNYIILFLLKIMVLGVILFYAYSHEI